MGGGTGLALGVVAALEGTQFFGVGGGVGAGGVPNSVNSFSTSSTPGIRNLLDSFGISSGFPALLTGSEVMDFTFSNPTGPSVFFVDGPSNVALVAGSITLSGSLTYNFTGEGALLSTSAPEPAPLALLAGGLVALAAGRRRAA